MNLDFMYAEKLKAWLLEKGCLFNEYGMPILPNGCFIDQEPTYVGPWHHRSYYPKNCTCLCFFMPDECIYPRIDRVFEEIEKLRQYHSICSLDLSVSKKMTRKLQNFNMLLNALCTAVLAYSGIKILPSLRCGDEITIKLLYPYMQTSMWILGIHGCSKNKELAKYDEYVFRSETVILRPQKLLLYGSPSKDEKSVLDDIGIPYRIYPDFRKLYKKGGKL